MFTNTTLLYILAFSFGVISQLILIQLSIMCINFIYKVIHGEWRRSVFFLFLLLISGIGFVISVFLGFISIGSIAQIYYINNPIPGGSGGFGGLIILTPLLGLVVAWYIWVFGIVFADKNQKILSYLGGSLTQNFVINPMLGFILLTNGIIWIFSKDNVNLRFQGWNFIFIIILIGIITKFYYHILSL